MYNNSRFWSNSYEPYKTKWATEVKGLFYDITETQTGFGFNKTQSNRDDCWKINKIIITYDNNK